MRDALFRLRTSLDRIRAVAVDMDNRLLTATAEVRLRDETVRCACMVVLSGFLESFMKECTEKYIGLICSRRVPFASLPKPVQKRHFISGGEILGQKMQAPNRVAWVTADHLDIATRLSSPADPGGCYTLVWEAYANTQGNPGPTVIENILEGLGVDDRQPRLDRALGGTYAAKRVALNSFIAVRNECAHTGSSTNIPTSHDLESYCDLLLELATAIVQVLETRISEAPFGVNLNRATEAELQAIPGLGSNRSRALLEYRRIHGPLLRVDDASAIPGFGPRVLDRIRLYAHV